jgi:DNA invertase Pin-like site-specific DNA recombinase
MGRLTLNVLLSFAQFEREVIGERIRDKVATSKRKGIWMAAYCLWAMRFTSASWSSITTKPPPSEGSLSAISNSVAFGG